MSNINGIGSSQNISNIQGAKAAARAPEAKPAESARGDRVELSNVNALLTKLKTNDVRTDKVADIKAQIEAGKYESDDKLDAAIDRLMDDLA